MSFLAGEGEENKSFKILAYYSQGFKKIKQITG